MAIKTVSGLRQFVILFCLVWSASCGLRTPPRPLAQIKPPATFSGFKVRQRGERIRISWKIKPKRPLRDEQRNKTLLQFDEPERPEFDEPERPLRDEVPEGFFVIQEKQIPLDCRNCEPVEMPPIRMPFSSDSLIREGKHFYYYLEFPQNNLNFRRQYKFSHLGPDDEVLSSSKTLTLQPGNLFPAVPNPRLKIVQIEEEKQVKQFAFGKVILFKTVEIDEDFPILPQQKNDVSSNPLNGSAIKRLAADIPANFSTQIYTLRLRWPLLRERSLERLEGKGYYLEKSEYYQINLYRTRNIERWPEGPLNGEALISDYYLTTLKTRIDSLPLPPRLADTHPEVSPPRLRFYLDLQDKNEDIWMFQLRLVDHFGNESSASETVSVQLPGITIFGQSIGRAAFVPATN